MNEPFNARPKITQNDVLRGYVDRYFLKHISLKTVIEVDKRQYDVFKTNSLYIRLQLKWVIDGYKNDITTKDGIVINGVEKRNQLTIDFYEKKMQGIKFILRNPLEYFSGVDNKM